MSSCKTRCSISSLPLANDLSCESTCKQEMTRHTCQLYSSFAQLIADTYSSPGCMASIQLAGHKIPSGYSMHHTTLSGKQLTLQQDWCPCCSTAIIRDEMSMLIASVDQSACLVVYFACSNSAGTCTSSANILTNSCALTISSFGEGDIARKMLAFDDSSTKGAVAAPSFSVGDTSI